MNCFRNKIVGHPASLGGSPPGLLCGLAAASGSVYKRQMPTRLLLILTASALTVLPGRAQFLGQKTYCNPIDINYQYNFEQKARNISYRAGADPVIVNHQGEYYLFVTISGGWWHSKDLVNWDYVKPNVWPREDICAPAALSVRGTLYLFQSTFERRPIYCTTTPGNGQLKLFNPLLPYMPGAAGPWDPDIFHDDDNDRWF